MEKIRGNKVLTGTWAEVWINGNKVFEVSKIEAKVTANREDIQLDMDIDSKITGLKGEGSMSIKKVYSRYNEIFEAWTRGEDIRSQIITKLADPDAVGKQIERYSIDNVWYNELPLVNYEKGSIIEEEVAFGFTPSDMQSLDKIS